MKILAVESSAKAASVAVVADGRVLAETFLNCGLTHSTTIMPSVEWVLHMTGINISDIDRIAVSAGPGSFTGLRIGMAAVKGLAWAGEIPCCAVSSLEAAAQNAAHEDGTICAVMDARAGQVYNALFSAHNGKLCRLCEDRAITMESLFAELSDKNNVILVGDGAELCYNGFGRDGICLAPEQLRYQRASGVARLAETAQEVSAAALAPEYIRLPQAERERLERLKG